MTLRSERLALVLLFVGATPASAEVTSQAAAGFEVHAQRTVKAPPAVVWRRLVEPRQWWNGRHSWSGQARNLRLQPRPGGCFCEDLRSGAVEHMRVIAARPNEQLRLIGALGPLQAEAVTGVLTIDLAPSGDGTSISFTYRVSGWTAAGLSAWAAPVDGVLSEQAQRLARLVDTGAPD